MAASLVDTAAGLCLPPEKRRIGYVFQDARLFPHYRVRGNLQYGMAAGMRAQFNTIVELLGIGPLLNRLPLTLSGGEKQRVAIGRALLTAPELLLMDEPLASLDLPRKRELLPYLERLAQDVNIPILYVSHSPTRSCARRAGDGAGSRRGARVRRAGSRLPAARCGRGYSVKIRAACCASA